MGGYGVRNEIEKNQTRQKSTNGIQECCPSRGVPKRGGGKECGMQYRSDNSVQGVLVQIEELPFHTEKHGKGSTVHGMK